MGYNHQSGRSHEREIVEHLRKNEMYAIDLATEKGIGQLTPEDGLLWPSHDQPSPLWHRGGEHLEGAYEYQAKWSKNASGFQKAYNAHERKEVSLGGPSNAHHEWRYGEEFIYWEEAHVCSGGIRAMHRWIGLANRREFFAQKIDYKLPSFLEKCLRADIVICRAPYEPFLCVWSADLD